MTFVSSKAEAVRIQEIANKLISEYPKPEILSIFTKITNCKEQEIFMECVGINKEDGEMSYNKQVVDMYHARYARTCTNWALENGFLVDRELTDYAERLIQAYYEEQEKLAITTLLLARVGKKEHTFSDKDGSFIETELNEKNLLKAYAKINRYKDANGLIIGAKPKTLVVYESLRFVAYDLIKTINDRYALKLNVAVVSKLPTLVEVTDWFIITDVSNVLMYCIGKDIYSDCNVKEDTKNIVLEVKGEYAFVALNPNCLFYAKGVSVDE